MYIYVLISELSDTKMPLRDYIVVCIEDIETNGRINPRNKEEGYVC